MRARGELTCLTPALLGPVPATLADALAAAGPFPQLESLLGRARRGAGEVADGETLLCRLAEPAAAPGAVLASSLARAPECYCYRAAPIHLRPDRDRLLVFAGNEVVPDADETRALVADFNRTFAEDGLGLATAHGGWVLLSDVPPGPALPALGAVAGRYLDRVIPAGADYRAWRRLLNEVQMFLHAHPVNAAREARGGLTVNGLWFWGGDRRPDAPIVLDATRLHGNDPLLRGLAAASQTTLGALDGSALESLAGESVVLYWPQAEYALLGGDAEGWLAAAQRFETDWAGALLRLAGTQGVAIRLVSGNGADYRLGPGGRWRFWRRRRPLRQSLVVE